MVLRQLRKPSDDPWSLNTGTHKSEQGNRSIVFSKNLFFILIYLLLPYGVHMSQMCACGHVPQ